jgi:hypothetical protein
MTKPNPNLAANEAVVGVYDTMAKAEAAVRALHAEGFSAQHISLVKRHLDTQGKTAEELKLGDDSVKDALVGGALGSLAGAAGAATLLSITGIGLILMTGPLVTLTGAIVGAFLGAMRGWGIHETNIKEYERLVESGHVLVVVAGEPREVEDAQRLLRATQAKHLNLHAKTGDDSKEIDDRRER